MPSQHLRLIRAAVCVIGVGAVALSVYRAFAMAGGADPFTPSLADHRGSAHASMPSMPAMPHPTAVEPGHLMGMPLSAMPEMFLSATALIILIMLIPRTAGAQPAVRLSRARARLQLIVCTAALSIDISKTSSLGFVIPGMRAEYGLSPSQAAMLAVCGLTGTMLGATLTRQVADRIRPRDVYFIAAFGFTVTSACGMMPTFGGNLVMCLLMGISVGGLAPMLIGAVRSLAGPARPGLVVTISLLATAVGFLTAAGTAAWLEPQFGWRAIWLIGAPTGILLLLVTPLCDFATGEAEAPVPTRTVPHRWQYAFAATAGVVAFGVSAWTPTLVRTSTSSGSADLMLVGASIVLVPASLVIGRIYTRFGPRAVTASLGTGMALVLVALVLSRGNEMPAWLPAAALASTLFGVNAMSAVLMPIAAASVSTGVVRAASTVSIFNRVGGLTGPLVLALLVTSPSRMVVAIVVMACLCAALAVRIGYLHRPLVLRREGAMQ